MGFEMRRNARQNRAGGDRRAIARLEVIYQPPEAQRARGARSAAARPLKGVSV